MKLRYEVRVATRRITIGQMDDLRQYLREYGEVIESAGREEIKLLVLVKVEDVYSRGDYGPPAWAREAAGLSEIMDEVPPALADGASAMLGAIGLAEWWEETTGALSSYTGEPETIGWSEVPEVIDE